MDYFSLVLACCVVVAISAAHIPEVYELNAPKQPQENYERPPVFNYQEYQKSRKSNQFDPQRIRYQQQQQLDAKPRQLKSAKFSTVFGELPTTTFIPASSAATITSPSRVVLEDLEKDSIQIQTVKGNIAKKSLHANSYSVKEEAEEPVGSGEDDSGYINYVDRGLKVVNHNLSGFQVSSNAGDQLTALSSLLDQSPENQLHGLQKLLNDPGHHDESHSAYYKVATDQEDTLDYPSLQNTPNVKNEQNHVINQALQQLIMHEHGNNAEALKSIQAQLDATANAHAESIIAQAQKKALEHVKAQHAAIAHAQKQVEQVALEKIKAQNEALTKAHADAEAEAKSKRQQEAVVETDEEEKRKTTEKRKQQEGAHERKNIGALAHKRKQETERRENKKERKNEQNDDAHTVTQNTRAKSAYKLKKFHNLNPDLAETHDHYFTTHVQPQASSVPLFSQTEAESDYVAPVIYSPATTQHKPKYNVKDGHTEANKYYIPPQFTVIGRTKNAHREQELQYAANYEFGYRIRDYDHGNEYGHKESKDGETTKGEYHALLPDGRMQTVTYYVDDSGYHAEVSYGGEASHH